MERSPQLYLSEIAKWADYLLSRAKGRSREDYLNDLDFRLAVERAFILIGEAMVLLKRYHPAVGEELEDATKAIGFRNFLVHQYWNIDHRAVWTTVVTNVEPLKQAAERLLTRLNSEAGRADGK
jgi:uncharacterized protein with HEPN domain